MPKRMETGDAVDIVDSILSRAAVLPEWVLEDDWTLVTFLESGEPTLPEFYEHLVVVAGLFGDGPFFYVPILPDAGYEDLAFTLRFGDEGSSVSMDDHWQANGLPDYLGPSAAGRYSLVAMDRSWVLYAERSPGLAFLAIPAAVDELKVRRAEILLSDSGYAIGNLAKLLSNPALPEMFGPSRWTEWAAEMRNSYGRGAQVKPSQEA